MIRRAIEDDVPDASNFISVWDYQHTSTIDRVWKNPPAEEVESLADEQECLFTVEGLTRP